MAATLKPIMNPAVIWGRASAPGDVTPVPQTKINSGYLFGEKPLHEHFNAKLQDTDTMLTHMQENGIATWDTITEYQAGGLTMSVGLLYRAIQVALNKPPETEPLFWALIRLDDFVAVMKADTTYIIGPNTGDFPTLTVALIWLSNFSPANGVKVTLEIETGYIMEERVNVQGLNFGWVQITSVDAEVVIDRAWLFANPTQYNQAGISADYYAAFLGADGTLPVLATIFRMNETGAPTISINGMQTFNSKASMGANSGIIGSSGYGIVASRGSIINAQGAIINNSAYANIFATRGGTVNADGAELVQNGAGPDHPTAGLKGTVALQASSGGAINCVSGKFSPLYGGAVYDCSVSRGGTLAISEAELYTAPGVADPAMVTTNVAANVVDTNGAGVIYLYE